jgi:hypothetical protein
MVYVYEVIKQFRFHVEGIQDDVRGEVLHAVSPEVKHKYQWHISHHYAPAEGAEIIIPR